MAALVPAPLGALSEFYTAFAGSAFRQGLTAASAYEKFIQMGFSVDVGAFFGAYRSAVEQHDAANYMQDLAHDFLPDPFKIPSALTKLRNNYAFTFRIFGTNPFTGEDAEQFITISSATVRKFGDLLAEAFNLVLEGKAKYILQALGGELISALRAGKEGTL